MDIFALLDQIQHIARNGLNYAQNLYDRERYENLMAMTADYYSELLDQPAEKIREMFGPHTMIAVVHLCEVVGDW